MYKKVSYYFFLLVILVISFRVYASVFFPGLNSDHAVTILMVHYFQLPDDLYFWGQDRMGSIIPLIAQIPNKMFNIPALYSEAVTHYFILLVGFFAITSFFRSYFAKILFALIWFLPPEREIDITQLTLSIQYVFLFIGIYFLSKASKYTGVYKHATLLATFLAFIISVWDSDLAMVSIGIFLLLYIIYLIKDNTLKNILKKVEIYYLVTGLVVGSSFIIYAKGLSPVQNNYSAICNSAEFAGTLKIFFQTVSDIFLFRLNETFTSIYSYLALGVILMVAFSWKKIKCSDAITKRLILFFLLDALVVFVLILITKWTYQNGVPRRYFNCTYISLSVCVLFVLENMDVSRIRKNVLRYTLLTTVIIGSFGTIYTMKVEWYHSFKPYADYMDDLNTLGRIGIIADYWNSYICSVKNPENIKATPHDKSAVRNWHLVDEVFKQNNIYLIKDGWLDTFPDTIKQFGRILIRQDDPFVMANANLCRYRISEKTSK